MKGSLASADEAAVVALAKLADRSAFEELVRRHQSGLRNLTRRLSGDVELADDLAQQAFLSAWRGLKGLRVNSAFGGWLRRLAVNAWVDHVRRRDPMNSLDEYAAGAKNAQGMFEPPSPIRAVSVTEGIDLDRALAVLAPPVRLCIVLSFNEGMSHREIADLTGLPLGTIKSHINRGLQLLRRTLGAV